MKCPHCNQEHPEGKKFCPFTGEEIRPSMQSCPNPDCVNYRKNVLPMSYQYCDECGILLNKEVPPSNMKNSNVTSVFNKNTVVDDNALIKDWSNLFPVYGISLGRSSIVEIAQPGKIEKTDIGYRFVINQYSHQTYVIQRYEDDFISLLSIDSYRPKMYPPLWKKMLGFSFDSSQSACLQNLKERNFQIIGETKDDMVNAVTPDNKYILCLRFFLEKLDSITIQPYLCPYCGSESIDISLDKYDDAILICSDCQRRWGAVESSRECAKELDGQHEMQDIYEYDEDGLDYKDDAHTYFDRPGRTVSDIYESILEITGDDYHLGDTLVDIGIDEDTIEEIIHQCNAKLSLTIKNELDVYRNNISDLIRLVQKYYYSKNKR